MESAEMEAYYIMNHGLDLDILDVGLWKALKMNMTMSLCSKEDCIGRYLRLMRCVIGLSQLHRQGITQVYSTQPTWCFFYTVVPRSKNKRNSNFSSVSSLPPKNPPFSSISCGTRGTPSLPTFYSRVWRHGIFTL